MSRTELGLYVGLSAETIANIEGGEKMNSLPRAVERMGIRMEYLNTGKGDKFVSGTDEENVARIKQGNKSTATTSDPWKDEAYVQIKQERDRLLDDVSKYKAWMNRIMNGEINFLAPLGNKASYGKLRIAKP